MRHEQIPHRPFAIGGATLLGRLRHVKGKARVVGLLLVGCGLVGCSGASVAPEPPEAVGFLRQEIAGLCLAVETDAWTARPGRLADTVFPLRITLLNTGTHPVTVARQDFVLLDQSNRQYLPIPSADVMAMFGGGSGSGVAVSPSIGIGGSSGGRTGFGAGLGFTFGSWGSDARDIIPLALSDGPVHAGAEVRGFLYFPHPAPDAGELRLVVIIRDLPGAPQVEFRFRRPG
jgi:hypothetical protein